MFSHYSLYVPQRTKSDNILQAEYISKQVPYFYEALHFHICTFLPLAAAISVPTGDHEMLRTHDL